jgi:hypothetical protein
MGQHMRQAGCESTVDFVQKRDQMFHVKRTRWQFARFQNAAAQ